MSAFYTGTAFYADKPAMIPLIDQLKAYARGVATESAYQWKRRMGRSAVNVAPLKLTTALSKRLMVASISVKVYDKYRIALANGEMTVSEMVKAFREKKKDVSAEVAALATHKILKVCGESDGAILWGWKG